MSPVFDPQTFDLTELISVVSDKDPFVELDYRGNQQIIRMFQFQPRHFVIVRSSAK